MNKNVNIVRQVYRSLRTPLAQSRKNLRDWNLPVRSDATVEPIPVRILCDLDPYAERERVIAAIRLRSLTDRLGGLIIYKDICVVPEQCRFFSLEVDEFPYFSTSKPIGFKAYTQHRYPRKLYITKECALRVKGFRGIGPRCPFKSVRELRFDQGQTIGVHQVVRDKGKPKA